MSGVFIDKKDEPLSTMAVLASREAAEEYIKDDPFVNKGKVRILFTCVVKTGFERGRRGIAGMD